MKAYPKTFPTTTNVIGFQSHLNFSSFFNFLVLVTEGDLRPCRVKGTKRKSRTRQKLKGFFFSHLFLYN
jgi:hypothetical protein